MSAGAGQCREWEEKLGMGRKHQWVVRELGSGCLLHLSAQQRKAERAVRRGKSWEREVKLKQEMAAGPNASNSSKASVLPAPLLQCWLSSCLGMQFPAFLQVQSSHGLLKCSCHP